MRLLTQPWAGAVDLVGVAYALGAAVCWGCYILLTQRVGDGVEGINGLAVSMGVAAIFSTLVVGPSVIPRITPEILLFGIGLAILLPVVPFTLEMMALRRLTTASFGTLMSIEPAFAMVIGFVVLSQAPDGAGVVGICPRRGRRHRRRPVRRPNPRPRRRHLTSISDASATRHAERRGGQPCARQLRHAGDDAPTSNQPRQPRDADPGVVGRAVPGQTGECHWLLGGKTMVSISRQVHLLDTSIITLSAR